MKFAHIRASEYFTFAEQIFHSEAISLARMAFFLAQPFKIDPYRKFFRNLSMVFGRWADLSLGIDGS